MNASLLLNDLHGRGIQVSANGDRLSADAPKGALTDELRQVLAAHKLEILALLGGEQRPTRPCFSCRSECWRRRLPERGGGWLCGACHPDPGRLHREWPEGRR